MKTLKAIILYLSIFPLAFGQTGNEKAFHNWALTPPMGWNSWDCFGPSVVETEVKANADFMAQNLLEYGWEYVIVDIRWYVDNQTTGSYNAFSNSTFIYDDFGRYMPSPTRFPSAADGAGFKPLADYVHGMGLKFGIHIMRGVPKKAVTNKLPIKGTNKTAADIYSTASECTWLQDNYTIDASKEGAQEYYNSILDLYASWGVDYIKVDDLSRPYHADEIELIRNAIDQTGRPIVFSMSPGATPIEEHDHAYNNANLWRTIDDFWDNWSQLNYSFTKCAQWAPYIKPGAWPDADMLPLGKFIRGERATNRYTNFTEDEQYTLMTLWTMFKSPLMFGGNLPDNQQFTNDLITNDEVLYVHKTSVNNLEWFNVNDVIAWSADDPYTGDKYVAVFNNGGDGFVKTTDLLYRSGSVSQLTDGYGEHIDVEIPEGSHQLFLIVNDGGDNYDCDHADWINPKVYLDNGDSIDLTEETWEYASSGWSTPQVNKSISGGTLNIKGTTYTKGIGTHSQSIILYKIPENSVRFTAFAGLDNSGTSQGCGSTVEFMLSTVDPTPRDVEISNAVANSGRISRTIQSEGVQISADITDAEKLYLVVTDAGDNYNYDHGDWINPAIYKDNGDSLLLTSLNWVSATSGWDQVKKNTSLNGNTLKVNGVSYTNGFGVNAYSTIEFNLPEGYTTFKAFCGYDDEVKSASNGVTIEFLVFTQDPTVVDSVSIPVDLDALGFTANCTIRDLWTKEDKGAFTGDAFAPKINQHGSGLYRISGLEKSTTAQASLSGSETELTTAESLTLVTEVKNTSANEAIKAGWVQLYSNDSLIANIELDENGEVELTLENLKAGTYTFTAKFGGNTTMEGAESNTIVVTVKEIESAVDDILSTPDIWVSKESGMNYIHGIKAGDHIALYNILGQKIGAFEATSDVQKLTGEGTIIIEVTSSHEVKTLKTVL